MVIIYKLILSMMISDIYVKTINYKFLNNIKEKYENYRTWTLLGRYACRVSV